MDTFYLVHVATGWVCYFSAQSGSIVMVDPIDGYAAGSGGENQIITGDDTGAGLVVINNVDKSLVFDVQGGNPALGTPVIPYKCNGGPNQRWRFNAIS